MTQSYLAGRRRTKGFSDRGEYAAGMRTRALTDGDETFDVLVLEAAQPTRIVLFAAGRGGDPQRHLPLLSSLAEYGCTVLAPRFEMIPPSPTSQDLAVRARRLGLSLTSLAPHHLPVVGLGHSIGATCLLALAGAQLRTRTGDDVVVPLCHRLDRLGLFAPALDFVRTPESLAAVRLPLLAWAGTEDAFAPPAQVALLEEALGDRVPVEVRIAPGAGHFSFMNTLPPQASDPLGDERETFLAELATQVQQFCLR